MVEKDLMTKTSPDVFKELFHQAISVLVDPRIKDHPDGPIIIQELNLALSRIVQKADATSVLWSVMSLIQ